jgi:hypothetical protein
MSATIFIWLINAFWLILIAYLIVRSNLYNRAAEGTDIPCLTVDAPLLSCLSAAIQKQLTIPDLD